MNKVINIYKPIGLTPLQLISKLRKTRDEYKKIKIGFAGRLDPMAHGVMLLMLGDETKNRNSYLGLSKEYEFEVMLGVSTDTYDALGILSNETIQQFNNLGISSTNLKKKINQFIKSKHGKHSQAYPPYSSKEVDGKPLFQWARENKLNEIKIPEREIEIYNFELVKILKIPAEEIHKKIISNIQSVDGDFRQFEIQKKWKELFKKDIFKKFIIAKFTISCSSGTYVRSLANELGQTIGTGAIAISILRTRVGKHTLKDSMRL